MKDKTKSEGKDKLGGELAENLPPQTPPNFDGHEREDENKKNLDDDNQKRRINETGSIITGNGEHNIYCLTIIGEVEGHYTSPAKTKTTKYEHVIPLLVSIEEDPRISGLLILLNTVGGDIEAGLALAEIVAGMKKPTVSLVIGGGHSIGVPLAVAAKRSFIVKSATMTVHPVRMNGLMLGVPQTFEYFQRVQERIINFVTDNSNIRKERFYEIVMNTDQLVRDIGTILSGEEAVTEGLIDRMGNLSDALDCLHSMIEASRPHGKKSNKHGTSTAAAVVRHADKKGLNRKNR